MNLTDKEDDTIRKLSMKDGITFMEAFKRFKNPQRKLIYG